MRTVAMGEDGSDSTEGSYGRAVGDRLRHIRRQKRLSLQEIESISGQEFKASVLGAYERGERAISVPRLARLANLYRVPVEQLLPDVDGDGEEEFVARRDGADRGTRIDLTRLEQMTDTESQMLSRYVRMIQVQRQDFNGRVLTIRRDDMRAIACILGVNEEVANGRLSELGLRMDGATGPVTVTL
ncbi:MAG TPA: transcriptional regulator [Microthrixaceae bacterium]|nr:transcriptional regulator [Microthrixaceae bacterium]